MKDKTEVLFHLRAVQKHLALLDNKETLKGVDAVREAIIFIEINYPENQSRETD